MIIMIILTLDLKRNSASRVSQLYRVCVYHTMRAMCTMIRAPYLRYLSLARTSVCPNLDFFFLLPFGPRCRIFKCLNRTGETRKDLDCLEERKEQPNSWFERTL